MLPILHEFVWKILGAYVPIFVEIIHNFSDPQILKGVCDENQVKNTKKILH